MRIQQRKEEIIARLKDRPLISRTKLCKEIGLSESTLVRYLKMIREEGMLIEDRIIKRKPHYFAHYVGLK